MKINWIAILLILAQSLVELLLWWQIISRTILSNNIIIEILSFTWVCTYFYQFISYSAASFLSPGYLRASWLKEATLNPAFKEELDDNGEKSFCEYCNIPRPLRAHHCHVCNKCVLIMDHHCDFIGNCVGYRNYKAFILFLLSFTIHIIPTFVLLIIGLAQYPKTAMFIVAFLSGLSYFGFFGYHVIYQLITQLEFNYINSTWIEYSKRESLKVLYDKAKVEMVSRFDTGSFYKNMQQRFGSNPLFWIFPTVPDIDPYIFQKNPNYVPVYELHYRTMQTFFSTVNEDVEYNTPETRLRESI